MSALWLTRTQPLESQGLANALAAQGWSVINLPVLRIEPQSFDASALVRIQQQVANADWVLWTSAHAVRVLPAAFFAAKRPGALHAVGGRTAQTAQDYTGQPVASPAVGHGGAAWVAGIRNQLRSGQRLLVITGEDGRSDWLTTLQEAGVQVDVLPVYRRRPQRVPLPEELPDAVIATSGAALAALHACEPPELVYQTPLIVPAERLKSVARDTGWSGRIASVPDLSPAAVQTALEECR